MNQTNLTDSDQGSDYGVQRSLGRIEGKLDSLLVSFTTHTTEDITNFTNINIRLSSIEKKVWLFSGIILSLNLMISVGHFLFK